jgi:hypothetical protein
MFVIEICIHTSYLLSGEAKVDVRTRRVFQQGVLFVLVQAGDGQRR